MPTTKLSKGKSFYQREPLTTRLKNLIHDYPEGIGIIKELVQNADDAGASCIHITRCSSFLSLRYEDIVSDEEIV